MNVRISFVLMLLTGITLAGCRRDPHLDIYLDSLNSEKRYLEDQVYELKYRLAVTAQDFKSAEKKLKPILEEIQKEIENKKGSFNFTREESKKIREG